MSSLYTPAERGGEGITSLDEWNALRGWNRVFAVYCSSDLWIGAAGEHVFEGDPDYRLYFEGALIAADGVAAGVAGLVSDDGLVTMPSLADATTVIVGGISAGSHGAAFHREQVAAAAPNAELFTIFDSMFSAAPEVMDPNLEALFDADHETLWTEAADPAWGAVLMDACVAAHPNDVWECLSIEPLLRERFIEGPTLWIHDLRDPVIYKFYEFWGVSDAGYQQLGIDTLRLYEDEYPDLSLHAYSCGQHTTIDNAATFSSFSVVDAEAGGPAVTIHDALADMLAGERVIAIDSVPASTSSCF
jgi:hypothetical protein